MAKIKTVAVVGGGVSGLSAAGLLSRQGFAVKLFEANHKLGGCCATTNLGGYTFDDGALYLVLPEILDRVFERLGLDRPSLLPLRRISAGARTVLPGGTSVTIGDGLNVTVTRRNGIADQATLQHEIDALLKKWEPVLRVFAGDIMVHPFSLSRLLLRAGRHLPKLRGTVASELNRLFSDEAVRAALSGVLLYTGLPPEKTPASSILGLVAMLHEGFFLPEGGMGKIPETLSQAVEQNGGEIYLNSKINRIVLKDGRACGLEVEPQGWVEADAVISTVSGMLTFDSLLRPDDVPAGMRRKIQSAPLSHKGFILQLGCSNKVDVQSHSNNVLPTMEEQYKIFRPDGIEVRWPIYSVPTVTLPELAPPGGSIIEMFPCIDQSLAADDWTEGRKEEVAASAVEALRRLHPIDVAIRRVLSPKEAQNSMHLYKGALYGLSPAADPRALFPHRTPVPGLYQAGQTTWPGYGVATAAMSGIFAAEALMNTEGA